MEEMDLHIVLQRALVDFLTPEWPPDMQAELTPDCIRAPSPDPLMILGDTGPAIAPDRPLPRFSLSET